VVVDGRGLLGDADNSAFVSFPSDAPVVMDDCVIVVGPGQCRPFSFREVITDHITVPMLLFLATLPLYLCATLVPRLYETSDED